MADADRRAATRREPWRELVDAERAGALSIEPGRSWVGPALDRPRVAQRLAERPSCAWCDARAQVRIYVWSGSERVVWHACPSCEDSWEDQADLEATRDTGATTTPRMAGVRAMVRASIALRAAGAERGGSSGDSVGEED